MEITAHGNLDQLNEVDVTIKTTMKLREWKIIADSLKRESSDNYHWTKAQFALNIIEVMNEFRTVLERQKEPK